MNYRTLGKTNLKVAEVGMGTWQLANDPGMWVGADPKESLASLHQYTELGGNFIDTAWVYGFSDDHPQDHPSEQLIGQFLKESKKRNDLIIATKVAPKNWHWPALETDTLSDCFPADHIETQVNDSLKSLGVDSIDLVQFHVWNDNWSLVDDWKTAITKIIKSGKVRYWGISVNDYQPANCLKTLDTGLISTVQFIFNIFHQKPTETLLPYAQAHNIGLIARVPLDEGGLTGTITKDTVFAPGDFRKDYFKGARLTELVNRLEKLKALLAGDSDTLSQLALRYILSFDPISTVIPGMRKTKHVISNINASKQGKLAPDLLEKLKDHSWERNFYVPDPSSQF